MEIPIDQLGMLGHTGDNPVMAYNRAMIYINSNEFNNAIKDLSNAIALDSNFLKAYEKRAYCYYRTGLYNDALQDFSKVYSENQEDVVLIIQIADTYRHAGNFETSNNLLNKALLIEPLNSNIYFHKAMNHFDNGDIELALSEFLASSALGGKTSRSIYYIGVCMSRIKKHIYAIKYFSHYINNNQGGLIAYAYYHRAIQYNQIGNIDEYKNDMLKASELGLKEAINLK